jgi:hypothetical protein
MRTVAPLPSGIFRVAVAVSPTTRATAAFGVSDRRPTELDVKPAAARRLRHVDHPPSGLRRDVERGAVELEPREGDRPIWRDLGREGARDPFEAPCEAQKPAERALRDGDRQAAQTVQKISCHLSRSALGSCRAGAEPASGVVSRYLIS